MQSMVLLTVLMLVLLAFIIMYVKGQTQPSMNLPQRTTGTKAMIAMAIDAYPRSHILKERLVSVSTNNPNNQEAVFDIYTTASADVLVEEVANGASTREEVDITRAVRTYEQDLCNAKNAVYNDIQTAVAQAYDSLGCKGFVSANKIKLALHNQVDNYVIDRIDAAVADTPDDLLYSKDRQTMIADLLTKSVLNFLSERYHRLSADTLTRPWNVIGVHCSLKDGVCKLSM